ncbi:5-oxoprolinase subunit PxpB [Vibrio mytili]|uniref:Allophanate hydrolase n=1 Tax=Vibrio mytili TaxID=50718 RepID=A0A0C3I7K3_9VIBR|nr:5-oxoprolinase subunit PxpB [Vibrio mytili]KIN10980.1 allophanate hydrolase [Vibrio mytili]
MKITVDRVSECCLIVYFGNEIDPGLIEKLRIFTQVVQKHYSQVVCEVIPSYTSVLIEYNPLDVEANEFIDWCHKQGQQVMRSELNGASKLVTLPVYYHSDVAPDLATLAKNKKLTTEQVIELHSRTEYTVCAIGFAPGFAFLGSVDPKISSPRHAEPRLKVAKGSVGIADRQTAVYPLETPGGWQIIGKCPLDLFNIDRDPMMPFEAGDKVRFTPIQRDEFLSLGGEL